MHRVAFAATALLAVSLAACGGDDLYNDFPSPPPGSPTVATTPDNSGPAPIDYEFLGLTTSKDHIHYRIKVHTDKKISQVDLALKETDDKGKVLEETTLIWQNIVKSKREPIENAKTYDVEDILVEGATKADATLLRVIFEDGTRWQR